ncbi:unnamed protein product [Phyllotreta striolata]|uniref:Major facilitator superfamily associated domain-containing protein n=1 Tax=Phyllotreta striolata TaxID=444603 RepID=A0A9N9TIT7_PHYSR|nr:unnamed protein product [Phyllotreta striolata]
MAGKILSFFKWNPKLVSLKCILFLIYGAIGSLVPFLPLHMNDAVGLSKNQSIIISVVAPLLAMLGPLIAAPLADRLAGTYIQKSKNGPYLRVMIAETITFAAALYWLLFIIPPVKTSYNITFICDQDGAYVLQDKCGKSCTEFGDEKGSIAVKNCVYTCNITSSYTLKAPVFSEEEENHEASDGDNESFYDGGVDLEAELSVTTMQPDVNVTYFEPHPHMCHTNATGYTLCEVYTEYSQPIGFDVALGPAVPFDSPENKDGRICKHPTREPFQCRIRGDVRRNLTNNGQNNCTPVVICELDDPYHRPNSLLRQSQCGRLSFWLYIFIRSLADMFLAATVVLLSTAVVIATRETSTGRGDVGKQFAAGALGFGIFAPLMGGAANGGYMESCICFTVLALLAVLLLLVDETIPLTPPEWWWHTRCGLLALPMSSVRKYGWEVAGLGLVLFLLGIFWNSIDAFLPWYVVMAKDGEPLLIGLTLTVGALPAVIFLIFAEVIVDYCGHNNILIFCFVNYVFHHLSLIFVENVWYVLFCEWLETFTLHVMYITAVLYLRHLVPRKYTACGQALPVIAHFCIGRTIGGLLGGLAYSELNPQRTFETAQEYFCIAAACVAVAYFVVYHFYLKPKCAPPMHLPPAPAPVVVQSMNGNGSYTPLRVYHNSKSKKGHFRY